MGEWLNLLESDMMKAATSKTYKIQVMMLRTEGLAEYKKVGER